MFRDLKEYQDIAKIYAEKVSKPENLEERVRGGGMKTSGVPAPKPATVPQKGAGGGSGNPTNTRGTGTGAVKFEKPTGAAQGRTRRPEIKKPLPTTAEIRAKDKAAGGTGMSNIPKAEGSAVIDGKKLNPDFGKKVDIKKEFPDKPKISKFTKQGKERTKAQMMAAKRIGSGTAKNPDTTIAQVKQSNQDAMRARAKERFAAFKAKRAEKKAAMVAKEEYTPYDIVLEYLLSTEQVATIEEANYVMTEMDSQTIQSVVKEFMGGEKGDGYIGHPRLGVENPFSPPKKDKDGKSINTKKTKSSKGLFKSLGNRATDIENKINNP